MRVPGAVVGPTTPELPNIWQDAVILRYLTISTSVRFSASFGYEGLKPDRNWLVSHTGDGQISGMAERTEIAVDERLAAFIDPETRDGHIVDILIEERCPSFVKHWTWPLLRPVLYQLL